MNKIIVDNNIESNDIVVDSDTEMIVDLSDTEKLITIHIFPNANLKSFIRTNNTKNNISYIIDENAKVYINKLSVDCSDNINIVMNKDNSNIKYNTSVINYKDNEYKQSISHKGDNITSKIVNHCINVADNKFKFIVDGIIDRESENIKFKQDNKIINLNDGKSEILPNLIVDNDDIEASHSAYIGTFNEEDKFYMMSRGLTEKECDDLLIKAFLLNDMELSEKEKDIYCSIIESINK